MKSFTVVGRPYPQGSLRPMTNKKTGKAFVAQKGTVLVYRSDIRDAFGDPDPVLGPIKVSLEFRFKRPKSHFKMSKGQPTGLKDSAPTGHVQRPDVDKLARSVLDALTDFAFEDDSQVVHLTATKVWWHNSETVVAIEGA